tara:strand:+ start:44 stop:712 length:669 start_codon:yes stop_codon:yes gene_type:complete
MNRQIMNKMRLLKKDNYKFKQVFSRKLLEISNKPIKSNNNKNVYFIRNARSYNDYVFNPEVLRSYDSVLTPEGKKDCYNFKDKYKIDVDVVYVSPLVRSMQTAELIFKDERKEVIEELVGYPVCGSPDYKRLELEIFKNRFKSINFDNFNPREDIWANSIESIYQLRDRIEKAHDFIINSPEKNICIISQNSFLIWFIFMKNKSKYPLIDSLNYCQPYYIKI